MSYWDTAALLKLYVLEPDSSVFEKHALSTTGALVTSRTGFYEASVIIRRKEAEGVLRSGTADVLYFQMLQDAVQGEIHLVEFSPEVERHYGDVLSLCYSRNPVIPIRTLDALHLAAARTVGDKELVAT